jgi:hypothetical protein
MGKKTTPLLDEHLQAMQGMTETGTDEFFYTRLKARIQKEGPQQGWSFPLKPVWIVGTLALLLVVNGIMLSQQVKSTSQKEADASSLQKFAESYDQAISSSY